MSLAQLDEQQPGGVNMHTPGGGGVFARRPAEAIPIVADCPGRRLPAYAFVQQQPQPLHAEESEDYKRSLRQRRYYRRVSSNADMAIIVPDRFREDMERSSDTGMHE